MPENLNEQLKSVTDVLGGNEIPYAVAALAAVVLAVVVGKVLARRRPQSLPAATMTGIDVAELGKDGPPSEGPILEHYYLPVRLAAIVLAPAGRVRELPPPHRLEILYDSIVPGLSEIVASHQPLVRRWPAQLSVSGFGNAFFRNVILPGDGGKGTVWSSAAGVARMEGQPVMVGLVFRSEAANNHGREIIDSEEHWLRVLCIKSRE